MTTVTDQAGRQRRSLTDALGRLERLDEPDASGNLGPVEAPTQPTLYAYDALDNLVRVTQGQQQRFWRYDSMGRLTHERQVEQDAPISAPDAEADGVANWSRRYEYTSRSQLSLIQDARGVQTTFAYDGLNRLQQTAYTDGTPPVTFTYDEARPGCYNRGRLTKVATAAAGTAPATAQEYDYDLMGRVTAQRQRVDGAVYALGYAYNSLDQLKSEGYPGGRLVFNTFDSGARVSSVTDGNDGRTYAGAVHYAPHGALTSETFGNGAVHEMSFNRRLQPASITLTKGATVLQHFRYAYGQVDAASGVVDALKNTGQIAKIEDFAGGTGAQNKRGEQRYAYDPLGRLDLAAEHRGSDGALVWRTDYGYDRYGNRLQSAQAGNQNYGLNYLAVEQGDVDPVTNRLRFATNNLEYDAAGNVKTDPRFRLLRYEYDANGRMRRTTNVDGGAESTAVYDGLGQMVASTAGGETHYFIYDAAGQIIAEYGPAGWERDRVYRGAELLATDEAVGTCRKTIGQFVESFHRGAFDRAPTDAERGTWVTRLRNAQGQDQAAVLAEARSLGSTLFNSAEYAGRQRSDEEFVTDLYWGYLQRAPDADGFIHWLNFTRANGRAATVTAFGQSAEFGNLVAGLCTSSQLTGELHWVLADHLGSVRVVTNSLGGVVGRRDNLPFGDSLRDVAEPGGGGGNAPLSAQSSSEPTGLWTWSNSVRTRYAGMEKDVATGLDHTPFRKYDSGWGRWTSPDPFGGSMSVSNPQSFNRYAYVSNDPVNMNDPLGLYQNCTTGRNGNVTCVEVGGGPGVRLDGGAIVGFTQRDTIYSGSAFSDPFFTYATQLMNQHYQRIRTEAEPRGPRRELAGPTSRRTQQPAPQPQQPAPQPQQPAPQTPRPCHGPDTGSADINGTLAGLGLGYTGGVQLTANKVHPYAGMAIGTSGGSIMVQKTANITPGLNYSAGGGAIMGVLWGGKLDPTSLSSIWSSVKNGSLSYGGTSPGFGASITYVGRGRQIPCP